MASIKTMLLGTILMLFGGILTVNSSGSTASLGFLLAQARLMFGVAGYFKKD